MTPAFHTRPLVYIAAPYSSGDPVANVRRAVLVAESLHAYYECTCVVPHITMLWHTISPHEVEHWYAYDLALLARCDALLRLDGVSSGADREVAFAQEHDIPTFTGFDELTSWLNAWSPDGRITRARLLHRAAERLHEQMGEWTEGTGQLAADLRTLAGPLPPPEVEPEPEPEPEPVAQEPDDDFVPYFGMEVAG